MSCVPLLPGVNDLAIDVVLFSVSLILVNIRIGEALGESAVVPLISCSSTASIASTASTTATTFTTILHSYDSKQDSMVFSTAWKIFANLDRKRMYV